MFEDYLSDRQRAWVGRGLATLGVAAVGTAVFLVVFGGVLPGPVREFLGAIAETLGQEFVAWTLALVGTAYAGWRVFRGRGTPAVAPDFAADPPEESTVEVRRTGHRFEEIVTHRARSVVDPDEDGEEIKSALRGLAIDVMTRDGERTREEVAAALESGEWTGDRVAAAFLGGDGAPGYPLDARVRGWLRPRHAFERRVDRSVDAIHAHFEAGEADRDRPTVGEDEVEVTTEVGA